jgi:superfamily II DNA or RNA helicase
MFIHVFVAPTKYQYKSTMKQAIGRVYRSKQKRDVHVYHFLMAKTIDVNILQEREDKVLVKRDDKFLLEQRFDSKPGEWEGPTIKGAACAAGDLVEEDDE